MSNFDEFMIGEATKKNQDIQDLMIRRDSLRSTMLLVLDCVDYTTGNCRPNEMVSAVLPKEIISKMREAIKA